MDIILFALAMVSLGAVAGYEVGQMSDQPKQSSD